MFGLFALLAAAVPPATSNADMLSEFANTCVAAKSSSELAETLQKRGWTAFPSTARSHLATEMAAVAPMLDAQGLSSDYVIYALDAHGHHFELAASKTKKALAGGHPLVGCSLYDFAAVSPVSEEEMNAFANGAAGQKSTLGDVQVEKWNDVAGAGSGMRAVFVPPASAVSTQLGFTGMMLGTHFLDGAK